MSDKARCAACFAWMESSGDGWVRWEMLGTSNGKKVQGPWLCPQCSIDREKQRAARRAATS